MILNIFMLMGGYFHNQSWQNDSCTVQEDTSEMNSSSVPQVWERSSGGLATFIPCIWKYMEV